MSYYKCVYHNCGRKSSDIAMFRFPVKHPVRLKLWIRNSGNDYLETLSNEELNRRYICAKNFPASRIQKNVMRSRLIGPAVPFHFEREEEEMSMDAETVNNEKMSSKMCRICLRSDNVIVESIDKRLSDFYYKITDDVFDHPKLLFCSLCEYKLRKFYNFRQRCFRSNVLLRKRITTPGPMDLESLQHLIPRDLALSMASDRRGFFDYKCQHFIADQNAKRDHNSTDTENEFELNELASEVMIDTDLIKAEIDSSLDDPIKVNENVDDICMEEDKSFYVNELLDKDAISDESITIDAKSNNAIKDSEKFTKEQLESFDLDEVNSAELKCIKKLLSPQQKRELNFRMELQNFKHYCINLLGQGKLDLGEVKMTEELFLDMFAKCDIDYLKKLGIVNQMSDIQKVQKFMLYLHNRYNPEYETIFKIDYLNTREQKIEEFESRKDSKDYIEATYKCEECYLPFTHQLKLDYHKKWHDPNLKEVCDICPMRFPQRSHLKKHKIYHYSVYRCKLCPVFTYYFSAMLNHYNQHKGKLYTCDICLGQYGSKSTLNGHRLSHARLTCEICARKFNAQHYLDKHMQLKHANAPPTRIVSPRQEPANMNPALSCDKCNAVFKSLTFLRRHMRKHETLFYKCRAIKCDEKFSSASELREHALRSGHHFRRPTEGAVRGTVKGNPAPCRTCPVCGVKVRNTSPSSLYNHHHRLHPTAPYHLDSGSATLCEHCGKAFWHHSLYLDHLNTHTGEKPYACKDCDARYSTRRLLYSHRMKVHCRLHQCKDCGKTFYNRTSYTDHTKIHTGERPHECNYCEKKFTQKSHLRTHILFMHTANKDFACDLCDKRFRRKACLTVHMMVHTGQRPHPCGVCDKQFYRKSELKTHVLKMHS